MEHLLEEYSVRHFNTNSFQKVKSLLFILECNCRNSNASVNSSSFCSSISSAIIDSAKTEGLALENMILQ